MITFPKTFEESLEPKFVLAVLAEAHLQAAREHYLAGTKLVVCRDGKVEHIDPIDVYPLIGQPPPRSGSSRATATSKTISEPHSKVAETEWAKA